MTTAVHVTKEQMLELSKRFLTRKSFELICDQQEFDIVAYDAENVALCFINVYQAFDSFSENAILSREEFEVGLIKFMKNHPDEMERLGDDCALRYDEIEVQIFAADRALLRHHINAHNKED